MIHRLVCEQQHEWQLAIGASDGTLDASPLCPVCGAPGKIVNTAESSGSQTPTLHFATGGDEEKPGGAAVRPSAGVVSLPGYEILGELGRGGMGVVYRARHLKLNRTVALKMIIGGGHASSSDLVRFLAEAQAVAALQHPNVVQLYDSGQHDGLPFFTLEYVPGGSLADMVREHPLTALEAARIVEQITRGIVAAHEQGLIHRDLKPENILIASDGTPKITDFGLAKKVEGDSGLTRTGALLGTPSYMAPEQAQGDRQIGPAADIYALGGILYRLVTGRPPFQAATPLDTVMQVVSDEPVPPRQLNAQVPRDLETIILKCLQKDPGQRYLVASELGDDLNRYLKGEPILARPIGVVGRSVRWTKRNPRVASLLGMLALTFTVGFAAVVFLWRRAEFERAQSNDNRERAEHQEKRAKANLMKAIEAVDRMLTRVVDERLAYIPQFEDERRRILEDAVSFYHDFLQQETDDPDLLREIGRAYFRLGKVFQGLGQLQKSRDAFKQAQRVQERLIAEQPESADHRNDLAQTLLRQGTSARLVNLPDEASELFERALAISLVLVNDNQADSRYRATLAELYTQLANNSFQKRLLERAEEYFQKSLAEWDVVVRARPADFEPAFERAKARAMLANYQQSLRKPEAEQTLRLIVTELEALQTQHAAREKDVEPTLAEARLNLGTLLAESNRATQADDLINRGLRSFDKLVKDYPLAPGYRYTLARGHQAQAIQSRALRKPRQSEESQLKAISLLEELSKSNADAFYHGIALRRAYQDLAQMYRGEGKLEKALECAVKAVASARDDSRRAPKGAPVHFEVARILQVQADFLRELNRHEEAVKVLDEAIGHAGSLNLSAMSELLYSLRLHRAMALARAGDHVQAAHAAEELSRPLPRDQIAIYNLACAFSVCAEAAQKDTQLPVSTRETIAGKHLQRAEDLIRQIHAGGYFRGPPRIKHLRQDPDLEALRGRAEFRKWIDATFPPPKDK